MLHGASSERLRRHGCPSPADAVAKRDGQCDSHEANNRPGLRSAVPNRRHARQVLEIVACRSLGPFEAPGLMASSVAGLIDHALLHPTLADTELAQGCQMARRLELAAVCVKPYAVSAAAELLAGSPVAVATVIGFPHGSPATETKRFESHVACRS